MSRSCTKCGLEKDLESFHKTNKTKLGRRSVCAECERLYYMRNRCQRIRQAQDWYSKNQRRVRNNCLKRNYGITITDFEQLLESQDHKCAMCHSPEPGGKGEFHVDHDHATGRVRGLLCHSCNVGLGNLGDDPDRAAYWLTRYADHQPEYLDYAI